MSGAAPRRAGAVTPTLHVGGELSIPHIRTASARDAIGEIQRGGTVVVPTPEVAFDVLLGLGVDPATAWSRVDYAVHGLHPMDEVDLPRPYRPDGDQR